MADARDDKFEGQDESEYHFSDEQMNYDMDETPVQEESKAPSMSPSALTKKISGPRRYIMGGIVFFVLFYIVYKMLLPSTPPSAGEITQVGPARQPAPVAQQPPVATQSAAVARAPAFVPAQTPPVMPAVQPGSMQPAAATGTSAVAQQQPPMQPQAGQAPSSLQTPIANNTSAAPTDVKSIVEKLDALAQQNARVAYALGTEYPQKFAAYEEQNVALQAKIQDLTGRLANLEASLNQLTQALQGGASPPPAQQIQTVTTTTRVPASANSKAVEPKLTYTVQAIIPGRAWLKSETGDTVTIAEGDMLKDFGRVIKIDPYDGVVEVDTGSRMVSLTYGGGGE